jgi:hypothetical protein
MRRLAEIGPAGRILAGILAVTWIAAGTAAFVLGVLRRFWVPLLLGPLAVAYGALWVRVARTGRKLDAPWPKRSP